MTLNILKKIINNLYLLIPLSCILFWAFIALYKDGFTLIPAADFPTFYYVSQLIFTQPDQIYFLEVQPYTYTPFFATVLAPMGLLTFEQAHWFYFFLILFFTELCLIIFNQILILKAITNRFHRFLILIILSNGITFVQMFDSLTGRIFTAFGLLWFLKREIKYRELNKDKNKTSFIFTQMLILVFSIGMTPQYFFLVLLYLFHNVKLNEICNKVQIKRYLLITASFFMLNFMIIVIIIINPAAILNLLGGSYRGERILSIPRSRLTYSYYEESRPRDPVDGLTMVILVLSIYFDLSALQINILLFSMLLMSIVTIMIHFRRNLTIEQKFAYWALLSLFFFTFTQDRYFVGLLPLIALLFLDYKIIESKNIIIFIKENYLILIPLGSIMIIYFMPPIHYLIRVFPFIIHIPIAFLFLRYLFLYLIIVICIVLLYRREYQRKEIINNTDVI